MTEQQVPTMSVLDFNKSNDLCLIDETDETNLVFTTDDYLENILNDPYYVDSSEISRKYFNMLLKLVSKVPVFKGVTPIITEKQLLELIQEHLQNKFGYDLSKNAPLEDIVDANSLTPFVKEFNDKFTYFSIDSQKVAVLDLREELKEMIENSSDLEVMD